MKIILDILTIITFTVGVVNIIEWTIKLPGKLITWYYDNKYNPK